jgi:hypothetical protein
MLEQGYGFVYYPKLSFSGKDDLFNHFIDEVVSPTKPLNAIYLTPIHKCNGSSEDESIGVWFESKKNSKQYLTDIVERDAVFCQIPPGSGVVLRLPRDYDMFNKKYGILLEGNTFLDWRKVQRDLGSLYLVDPPIQYDWSRFYEGLNTIITWTPKTINACVYYGNRQIPTRTGEATFNITPRWKFGAPNS